MCYFPFIIVVHIISLGGIIIIIRTKEAFLSIACIAWHKVKNDDKHGNKIQDMMR